ncbi:hypothetical protein [uncultured Campylobacter sp.]|uniref:hypothetical protein n=1 Tax=uncultured Campylobacter sp. TaxID=218934 RepID=UPI0026383C0E|nr:hypothetical protein [uncultured Campylobacter sp.]
MDTGTSEQDESAAPKVAAAVLQKHIQAAQPAFARSFSGAEGVIALAHSLSSCAQLRTQKYNHSCAQSDAGGGNCSPRLVHNSDSEANRPRRNLNAVSQPLALRLTARSSTGEDNRSACVRLIQAKKSN